MNEIFPLVTVHENSLYLFWFLCFCLFVAFFVSIYFYRRNPLKKDEKYYLNLIHKALHKENIFAINMFEYYLINISKTEEQQKQYEGIVEEYSLKKYQKQEQQLSETMQKKMLGLLEELRLEYA